MKNLFKHLIKGKQPPAPVTQTPMPVTGRCTQKIEDVCTAASTHIGQRPNQQDCFRIPTNTPNGPFLCVLCDGMGGMESGEIASRTAADTLKNAFETIKGKMENPFAFLEKTICEADRFVSRLTDKHGNILHSGSTLLAAIVNDDKLYWASVGDSRIYLLRGKKLQQLTRDQTYSEILLQQLQTGQITVDEANADPQKDALTHFVGMGELNNINMPDRPLQLKKDDLILLCSDGLYRTLEPEEIRSILTKNSTNLPFAAWALVQAAINKRIPQQDNTTVVLLRRKTETPPEQTAESKAENTPSATSVSKPEAAPDTPQKTQRPDQILKPETKHKEEKQPPAEKEALPLPGKDNDEEIKRSPAKPESANKNTAENTSQSTEKPADAPAAHAEKQPRPKPDGLAVTELIR